MVATKQTMNINEEDIDLRLGLGSRNYSAETRLNSSSSGAGVNANSRTGMPFPASDPLSELVWSPHNGLSLKCADSNLPHNGPFFTWNMGDSTLKVSTSQPTVFRSPRGSSSSDLDPHHTNSREMGEDGSTDAIPEGNCQGDEQKVQIADIAESSKRSAEQDTLDDGEHDKRFDTSINLKIPSKLKTGTYSDQDCRLETHASKSGSLGLAVAIRSLPNIQSRQEQDDEVTLAYGDVNKRLESSAENELSYLAAKEAQILGETDSRICLYREKGKEKASSEVDVYARSSNDENNSHGSMESCSSTGLLSKGIKRQHYDQDAEIMGSKRMRKQVHRSHACTPTVKPNSSFLSWISNMVKGLPVSNEDEPSPLPLTLPRSNDDCTRPNMGFHTVFQSMYSRGTNVSRLQKDHQALLESRDNVNSCKQIILSDKQADFGCTPDSSERSLFGNKALECNRDKGDLTPSALLSEKVDSTEKMSPKIPLPVSCMPEKSSPLSSLWITRLYLRAPTLENDNQITHQEARDCSSDCSKANLDVLSIDHKISEAKDDCIGDEVHASIDFKSIRKLSPVRSSEAMVSVFAKRMGALRHIIHKSPTLPLTCFYCGTSGHELRQCQELKQTELENMLVRMSSFERVKEFQCLCIRCFKLGHWAISCPSISGHEHRQSEPNAANIDHYTSSHLQLCPNDKKLIPGSFPGSLTCYVKESSLKKLSTSSNSEHHLKDEQIFRYRDVQSAVPLEEMFHTLRKLRLSRADVLRWMNSNVTLSHLNGFFLRLRLGKLEGGGQGGTSYYVACIKGDTLENIGCNSMKSILVDVGGIKSSVGSQYISNHDFLEHEVKGWWSRIVKAGGKIPSLDELNSKLEDRKRLGF